MSDQKFDPVKEFVNLRDSVSKAVGEGIRGVASATNVFPAVDVYETEDSVIIYTEPLIGMSPEKIEVSMEDDILTISGETQRLVDVEDTAFLHRELRFGPFAREVRIPRKVKAAEAKASFKQGVLTISLPKVGGSTSQIINVTPAE